MKTEVSVLLVLGAMFIGCKDQNIASTNAVRQTPVLAPSDDRGVGPSLMTGQVDSKPVIERRRAELVGRNKAESESLRREKHTLVRSNKEDLFRVVSDNSASFERKFAAIRLLVDIGGKEDVRQLLEIQNQYWEKQKSMGMNYDLGRIVSHIGRAIPELEVKGMNFDDQVKTLLDPKRREIGHRANMLVFALYSNKDDEGAITILKRAFESADDIGKIWIIRAVIVTGSRFAGDIVKIGLSDRSVKVRQSTIHDMALIDEEDLKKICDKLVDYKDAELKTRKLDYKSINKQWHPARIFFVDNPLSLE